MMFSQLATKNVQQGIRDVRQCQKAENCVIKLGISCPIACCSNSKILHIVKDVVVVKVFSSIRPVIHAV